MKIKRAIKYLKSFPWPLCLLVIMCLVRYAYADGIEDQLDHGDTKFLGKGGKLMLGSAVVGGGTLAVFKSNVWGALGALVCAVATGLSLYFVNSGMKI